VDAATARAEIEESKKRLEAALERPVTLFAYPYGETNELTGRLVSEAGFEAAFATDRAPDRHETDLFRLRRAVVFPRNNPWEVFLKAQFWYPRYQDWKRS
jgi:peptidoglycan/xylan/chitin deacetylase (PgdA/CDA1 family)